MSAIEYLCIDTGNRWRSVYDIVPDISLLVSHNEDDGIWRVQLWVGVLQLDILEGELDTRRGKAWLSRFIKINNFVKPVFIMVL